MTYQQVRDVISQMRKAHQRIRDALEEPQSESPDPRTRMMLEALQQEEQELQKVLARSGAQEDDGLLDTWLQYVPDEEVQQVLACMEFAADMPADEIVARKREFDQAMADLLRRLADETSVPRVEEFFRRLLENIETRTAQKAWSLREYQAEAEPPRQDQ